MSLSGSERFASGRRNGWLWSLLAALAVVPLVWASRGTPLGEPFADDFDFLRHAMFTGHWQLLDGGGGGLYWRPLARQVYYELLGPLLLSHPIVVALLHALAFALAAVCLQRALARVWPAPLATLAAVFPLALPGARVLIAWPSGAQDLGVFAGLAAALYALSRGRTGWALAATAAALLCKEVALPLALLLPLAPWAWQGGRAARRRFALQLAALLAVYGATHELVRRAAHQLPLTAITPHDISTVPWLERIAWALGRALGDAFASPETGPSRQLLLWGIAACFALALAGAFATRAGRQRIAAALPWFAWGVGFWVLASLPLAPYHPAWMTYRSIVPALGLGIASAALLSAAWPGVWLVFAGLHLAGVLVAPGAAPRILEDWPDHGSAFDFPRLTQVQRFVHGVRLALEAGHPPLPPGAVVVRHAWPRSTDYAFQEGGALQVWYRDSRMRAITFEAFRANPAQRVDAIVEFQPHREPQLTRVPPPQMRTLFAGVAEMRAGRYEAGLATLEPLAAAADTVNALFLATVNSKIATGHMALGQYGQAESAAARAYALYPDDQDARVLLAQAALHRGDAQRARELLRAHLVRYPDDAEARALLAPLER